MEIKKFLNSISESKGLKMILWVLVVILAITLIFQAGVIVGYRKATFSMEWANNYRKNFEGQRRLSMMWGNQYGTADGAEGTIISIASSTLVVSDNDKTEKTILINANTSIREFRQNQNIGDLKVGNFVVVIGTPTSNGELLASLIRIIPSPNILPMSSSTSVHGW